MNYELFNNLKDVQWDIMARTYGSSHHTLIGLLAHWWVHKDPENEVLDEPPDHLPNADGKKGRGDLMLLHDRCCKGIVEVERVEGKEGKRERQTMMKIREYFSDLRRELQSLEFGVFLAYATLPRDDDGKPKIPLLNMKQFIDWGYEVVKDHDKKQLIILTIDKVWEQQEIGPRALNKDGYYNGRPFQVRGALIEGDVAYSPSPPIWSIKT